MVRIPAVVAWFGVLGCSGSREPTAPQSVVPLIPLTVGTVFTYRSTDTLSGAVAAGEQVAPDSTFTVRVTGDVADKSGLRWAGLDHVDRLFGPATPAASFFANTSDGLRRVSNTFPGGITVGVSYVIFAYPASTGAVGAYSAVLSTADTVIVVPAGTFHCLRYDEYQPIRPTTPMWTIFIAPGIGVVQRSLTFTVYYDRNGQVIGRHDRIYRLVSVGAS